MVAPYEPGERVLKQTRRTSAQNMRDTLEDDIINGRLVPGERLDPEQLGKRFGMSRTPVREAIQQLQATGLVHVAPKRGTFVAEVGISELIEMFEVMAELEGMCGRLAARRITTEQLDTLRASLQRCEQAAAAGNSDDYYYENESFHRCIYAASHNSFLAEEAYRLHCRLKPYRRLQLRVRSRVNRSFEEHRSIVEALASGSESDARERLRSHILVQGERFNDLIANLQHLRSNTQRI